jgi:hypothetical protein
VDSQIRRLNRDWADEGLWINLWKLWIARELLVCRQLVRSGAGRRAHVSMDIMNEVEVTQADVAEVPATFDRSVVLFDVRADDEWQRGHAAGAQQA